MRDALYLLFCDDPTDEPVVLPPGMRRANSLHGPIRRHSSSPEYKAEVSARQMLAACRERRCGTSHFAFELESCRLMDDARRTHGTENDVLRGYSFRQVG